MASSNQHRMKIKLQNLFKNKTVLQTVIVLLILALMVGGYYFYNRQRSGSAATSANLDKATELFAAGKVDKSLAILEGLRIKEPDNQTIIEKLASEYYQAKKYDKFIDLINSGKLNSSPYLDMAGNIYQSRGDDAKALEYYRKATNDSGNAQSFITLAAYYQTKGDYNQALNTLREGIEKFPKSVALNISAASVCLKIGDEKQARIFLDQALIVDQSNQQAKTILEEL